MPHNNYFRFKQFIVQQNNAAMRVGTDGVLLGAWAHINNDNKILDIGTGTGVIALMLAQRSMAHIDAIDIDAGACSDATNNFSNSPWAHRLQLIQSDIKNFANNTSAQYDHIVCNPPYFENAVKPHNLSKKNARHTDSLPFELLLKSVSVLLKKAGKFSVIVPANSEKKMKSIAADYKLFSSKTVRIKPKPSHKEIRVLMEFTHNATHCNISTLTIETQIHHTYTPEFIDLTKSFYLQL